MEDLLTQMQSVILAEHRAKVQCLEDELSALRKMLGDKEAAMQAGVSARWCRSSNLMQLPVQNSLISGCSSILLGSICSVKVADAIGTEVVLMIHRQVLDQVPYFSVAGDFAERAGTQDQELSIVLPAGCPCKCATVLFWRLYVGDACPLGSAALPVSSLDEALALGKVADMLMIDKVFSEIDAVARRLAFHTDNIAALLDPCLPEFLQSLATQIAKTPQLSEAELTEMLESAAVSSAREARSQAESLLASNQHFAAPVVSALTALARKGLHCTSSKSNVYEGKEYEPLFWLLDVAQSRIDDPTTMMPFFKEVSIMQSTKLTQWKQCGSNRNRRSESAWNLVFSDQTARKLCKAFAKHMERCATADSILESFNIIVKHKEEEVEASNRNLGGQSTMTKFPNALGARSLDCSIFPGVMAKGVLLGCRESLVSQILELSVEDLQHMSQPQLLKLLTPEEELQVCKKIAVGSNLSSWATAATISALAIDARRFVCTSLSSSLGQLPSDVRDILLQELQ